MLDLASAAPAAATLPLVPAPGPARQGFGLDPCRYVARAILGARPRDRQPGACARRWRPRSAPAMPRAPGCGRTPTRRSKRRRSCSCANSARRCARAPGSAAAMLEMLTRLAARLPTQTRRSEESEHFQQFSTPITLGFAAAEAAALTPADLVLEPSAGTGLLAIFAELRQSAAGTQRDRRHPRRTARAPVPRHRRSPATTPSRSTTGSIRRSGRAWC